MRRASGRDLADDRFAGGKIWYFFPAAELWKSFGHLATEFWQGRQPSLSIVEGDQSLATTLGQA
jgi:hypothetical protein